MHSVDVLCVGQACYDLVFTVNQVPQIDTKIVATDLINCGGGPAANAACAVTKLGCTAAFAGYLGTDAYGQQHAQEFVEAGVNTSLLQRDVMPTPISVVLVQADGSRALINYTGNTPYLSPENINFSHICPKVILLDGHQPYLSADLLAYAKKHAIPTVLDAGSLHIGTSYLMDKVDYLVASEKFALQCASNLQLALAKLARLVPTVVITLGNQGLIWQRGLEQGNYAAFKVLVVDTNGAGDAFHAGFVVALAQQKSWNEILTFASATGALCCTKLGARLALPTEAEQQNFLATNT